MRAGTRIVAFAISTGLLLEVGAFILLGLSPGDWRSRADLQASLAGEIEVGAIEAEAEGWHPSRVLYPYIGFVFDADRPALRLNGHRVEAAVNQYGFLGPSPLTPASADRSLIALTGGSVAAELFAFGGDGLRDALLTVPRFAGKELVVVSIAIDGMKQPQQMMSLSYFCHSVPTSIRSSIWTGSMRWGCRSSTTSY